MWRFKALQHMLLLVLFTCLFKPFFFLNKKEIWFFIDRPYWIDNAYFLYNYVKNNDKNIKSIYLIENSQDREYKEMTEDNGAIDNLSLKHFWYFVHAKNIIFSFDTKPFLFYKEGLIFKYILKPFSRLIFIQHWVTKAFIEPYSKQNTNFGMFTCVSKKEKSIVEKLWYTKEIKITWFPRFDNLLDFKTENQIMFMPSWKMELYWKSEEEFCKSGYFKWINNLLNSKEISHILEQNNYKLIFIPHYMMNKYIHLFNISNKNIKIVNTNLINRKNDVQLIMKESKLLITDYSSIMFDFAYMKKPSIYYHFHKYHYKDLIDYEKELFWDIAKNITALENVLATISNNDFKIEDNYKNRIERFFYKIDWNNCKRLYNEIKTYN